MSKIMYEAKSFTAAGRDVVTAAERICQDYAAQGYSLTLRQLYYRFIATDAFPEDRRWSWTGRQWVRDPEGTKNAEPNYKWLGDLVSNARIGGLIDWRHLTDRTRNLAGGDTGWLSPQSAIRSIESAYGITHWNGQEEHIEVWVEKEALADIISRPANRWDVAYFACKGYVSQSEMHDAAQRLRMKEDQGKKVTIIHLGDHDPSGIDMTRDIQDRLRLFRSKAKVKRIALNMDQIDVLQPPPSPTKLTDSRASSYLEEYGDDCWELDAIEPAALEALVEDEIQQHLNRELYDERLAQEERERATLTAIMDNYDDLVEHMRDQGMLTEPEEGDDEDDES